MKPTIYTTNRPAVSQTLLLHLKMAILLFSWCVLGSCKKFLDAKPNQKLEIPSTYQDIQALLDDNILMNYDYPTGPEIACDDYYLSSNTFSAQATDDQEMYTWAPDAQPYQSSWDAPYQMVLYANTVLETLAKIPADATESTSEVFRGSAYFFRGFAFYNLAQSYCKTYFAASANTDLGIPLRLSSDINIVPSRATVQQTYDQIIADLKKAAILLPVNSDYKTRPTRIAALGALARTFLSMSDYKNAGLYADSALNLYSTLIDYNTLNGNSSNPFQQFNTETIFYCYSTIPYVLEPYNANIDSNLLALYDANDLRRSIYFTIAANGQATFKGSYDGTGGRNIFNGITTDELFLVRAECYARSGNIQAALKDLNTLLSNRWLKGAFNPINTTDQDTAIATILTERRKELVYRGARWTDLRRLNFDPKYSVTLTRTVNGQSFTLPPNDLRYVFLIPPIVITLDNIQQNPR